MPYSQYRHNGRSLGKILHCLYRIGVPLRLIEEVILENNGNLTYYRKPFCSVEWKGDEPVFTFTHEFRIYQHLQEQYEENIPYLVLKYKASRGVMEWGDIYRGINSAKKAAIALHDKYKINPVLSGVSFFVIKSEELRTIISDFQKGKKFIEFQAGSY